MPSNMVKADPAIRPLGPITEADKQGLLDANRLGLTSKETARKLGLSENQVTAGRKRWGITSEPKPYQKQASEAFATRARKDRHARYDRWASIFEKIAGQLDADLTPGNQSKTILKGAMGVESEVLVDNVPARDLRERIAAGNIAEVQLQKIAAMEDDQGLARGLSMMEKFFEAAEKVSGRGPAPREGLIQE